MKIILFSNTILEVSGLKTFELSLMKQFHKDHEIIYVYNKSLDDKFLKEVAKYGQVIEYNNKALSADLCIFSSIVHNVSTNILKATKYVQVLHADLRQLQKQGITYTPMEYIDFHITVGESAKAGLKELHDIDSIVIPNILGEASNGRVLRLATASRIVEGKGFDRLVRMAKRLKMAGIEFVWEVYGDGSFSFVNNLKYKLSGIPEVVLLGTKDNIQQYIRNADYLVHLSDSEGFCYAVHEALQIGVPCIVTNYEGVGKVIEDGVNGYIYDMDLSNLDIDKLCNHIPKDFTYTPSDGVEKWEEFFVNINHANS